MQKMFGSKIDILDTWAETKSSFSIDFLLLYKILIVQRLQTLQNNLFYVISIFS